MADRRGLRVQLPGVDVPSGEEPGARSAAPMLVPVMAVGMSSVPGGVCLLQKDTVVYPVGRSLAMYCPTQLSHVRISEPLRSVRGISAVAVSPNKKYLAAAENMADGYMPQVTVFDATSLERLASVTGPGVTGAFTSVSFSGDGSLLLACGTDEGGSGNNSRPVSGGGSVGDGPGTSTFHLWEWGASPAPKCSATVEGGGGGGGGMLRAALDPRFDSNVLVMSRRDVGLWRQSTNGFKRHTVEGAALPPGASFVDLSALPDGRFLLATSTRQVLLVDRAHAKLAFTADRPLVSLLGLPDGSIAVGTEKGYLQLYRRAHKDDPDHYAIFSETRVPESAQSVSLDGHIRAMSVDAAGDTLLCATAGGGPAYQFNLAYARTLALTPEVSNDLWEMLLPGSHEQSIISASLAFKRDFLATASKDLTVRVWQTAPLRLVLTHMCHHSPLALAMDPYGRELVVAYVDGVRCYSIVEGLLVEGEELMHEFGPPPPGGNAAAGAAGTKSGGAAKASLDGGAAAAAAAAAAESRRRLASGAASLDHCSLVAYSPTGALIAAAAGPGGRHVYIFSTLTKRQLAVLAGHYEAVLDLAWSDDGQYLATSGEGAVFTWSMDGFVRVQENTSKLYLNDAIACTPDFRTLVVGDTTQGLRIMDTCRGGALAGGQSVPGTTAGGNEPSDMDMGGGGGASKLAGVFGKALAGAGGGGTAAGSVPDSPIFRVPGRSSLVPIGNEGAGLSGARNKMQAVSRIAMLTSSEAANAAANGPNATANNLGVTELRLRSNFQTIIQPARGGLAIARVPPGPSGAGGYEAVIGTGVLGRLRVCPLRPRSNEDVDEYYLHASDVTQVVAHRDGRILITTDASGCWVLNVLLPYGAYGLAGGGGGLSMSGMIERSGPSQSYAGGPQSPTRAASPTRASSAGLALRAPSVAGGLRAPSVAGFAGGIGSGTAASHADRTTAAHKLMRVVMAAYESARGAGEGGHGGHHTRPHSHAPHHPHSAHASKGGDRGTASGQAGGPAGDAGAQLIVSVRAVDVQLLKENVRELKDRLAKAATEAEYKMYEREQGVRRELEGEVSRLRNEVEVLRADLAYTRATASEDSAAAERQRDGTARDFERALREQQDLFEKKLAAEISRTDAAEREMQRLRAKFGRKLWALDEQHATAMSDASDKQASLESAIEGTRADAARSIASAQGQMEQELRIDGELNEEELQRSAEAAQKQLEEKDEAYLKLLAKHTLQSGLNAKTSQENDRLRAEAEALRRENTRLAEQVMALTEELEAMQAAWADRDARQRQQDAEMKDMAFQMQQAQLFTSLATTRIKELNNELEPVRAARDEAQGTVAGMESVAQRQLERQARVVTDNATLHSRVEAANEEIKRLKGELLEREAYFKNFTTQLFRTVQDVPHHQWPTLFGRMIDDYHKNRDKASWARYLESDRGANAHPPGQGAEAARSGHTAGSSEPTASEAAEKIAELHAQLLHTERMLSLLAETKDKADRARRAVVSKLMNDNMMVVQELNDTKRDLKAAREAAEKRAIELSDLRMAVAVAGLVAPQVVSGTSTLSLAAASAAPSDSGGATDRSSTGGGGLPQGPAGRAMARLPSRLGDPAKTAASGPGSAASTAGGGVGGNSTSGSGAGATANGGALTSISPRDGVTSGSGQGVLWGGGLAASTIPEDSALPPPHHPPAPPMVVTGDMPQGGWWLGECSPFELPASLDHLASASLRRSAVSAGTPGGADAAGLTDRPGTSVLGRRPGTSQPSFGSSSNSGPASRGGTGFLSNRTAFTPPTPHTVSPGRRPDTSGSLVAAAVSGAALQAYNQQRAKEAAAAAAEAGSVPEETEAQAAEAAASANGGSSGPGSAVSTSPGRSPRVLSAGPAYGEGANGLGSGPGGRGLPSRGQALRSSGSSLPGGPLGATFPGAAHAQHGGSGGGGGGYGGVLTGQVRPSTPSKVTTMGAGFRSFVPTHAGPGGSRGSSR
ncbi:hypothetical protein HYH03_010908 [Edaphochlamys debaryana]|uniref:Uncharacterized protein n=1 Tax=Edaphochlamys debaryana TaxID=47281 RepID=A0A835XVV7_9CHLO|nr:hypothetical protein HYH03_010908 [Edaphochlamys debaryana]|eukprot:KAG2490754.1 hypothetical protein HYH03_010908 [Edaphochlamys debaryana]